MDESSYEDLLESEGFQRIGSVDLEPPMRLYWQRRNRIELAVVDVGAYTLLRGTKPYRVEAIGESGEETYARDLAAFDSYLRSHFAEVHVYLSHFTAITPRLARRRIQEKRLRHTISSDQLDPREWESRLEEIRDELDAAKDSRKRDEGFFRLDGGRSPRLQQHLRAKIGAARRLQEELLSEAKTIQHKLVVGSELEREYMDAGQSDALCFVICSDILVAQGPDEFREALHAVTHDLWHIHHFELRQKLEGGRLRIYTRELEPSSLSMITRWTGAILNPQQLERLGPEFEGLRQAVEQHVMIHPQRDIELDGAVKDPGKRPGAHMLRNIFLRLERVPDPAAESPKMPSGNMPVWLGNNLQSRDRLGLPSLVDADRSEHVFVEGQTGGGKSFAARTYIEGCTAYNINIVVHDPRNQSVGLRCPEDRPEILARYEKFGLKPTDARGFPFIYHRPAENFGEPLPDDLRQLATGLHIVCYKGMDDEARCNLFADIMNSVHEAHTVSESEHTRSLQVVEEAKLFTKGGVFEDAKPSAERAEQSIDRIAREGRKYGVKLLLISQREGDFMRDAASVRQNIKTRIFLATADTEIERASLYLADAKELLRLRPGQAIVVNPEWPRLKIAVRPPFSKVRELSDEETRRLLEENPQAEGILSDAARAVLSLARERHARTGEGVKLSSVTDRLGITSRRKVLEVMKEIQQASLARFERSSDRGHPVVMIPFPAERE